MSSLRLAERERAAAERTRASRLCARSRDLRKQADLVSGGLVETLRRLDGRPLGDRGDTFSLHLPRLPIALGLVRQALTAWLERCGVGDDDAAEISLACSEACANAMEHPQETRRPAVQVAASLPPGAVEVVVRDFGSWGASRPVEAGTRGRGLEMIHTLMDDVAVAGSARGTTVTMRRRLSDPRAQGTETRT
jgi:anti-sigma regulatory factor (Ser/Thr protein kinase)